MRMNRTNTIIETAPRCPRKRGSLSRSDGVGDEGEHQQQQRLLVPSIYRYTCHGIYSVSSKQLHDNARGALGTCHGIRSQIEHVRDLNVSQRDEAIQSFAAIEHGQRLTTRQKAAISNKSLVSDPNNNNNNDDDDRMTSPSSVVRESWGSLGVTEVECLKLTDVCDLSKAPEIVAVAPSGSMARHTLRLGNGAQTSIFHLGLHQMALSWTQVRGHAQSCEKEESNSPQRNEGKAKKSSKEKSHLPTSEELHFLMTDENFWTATIPDDVWLSVTRAAAGVAEGTSAASNCYFNFSKRLLGKMQSNGLWFYQEAQKDMLGRTVKSARRIVNHMPKTVNLLAKTARRLAGFKDDPKD